MMTITQYAVIYEKGEHNWGEIIPDLPVCVSIGYTLEKVQENAKEAIAPPPHKKLEFIIKHELK